MGLSTSALRRSGAIAMLPARALGRSAQVQFGVLRGGDRTELSNAARSATAGSAQDKGSIPHDGGCRSS